jgi:methionyl-tRNA synthetase
VERFWTACADAGDLYRKHYEGLYCVGCAQLATFLPGIAARISRQCTAGPDGRLPSPSPVFARLP